MTKYELSDQISELLLGYLEEKFRYKSPVLTIGIEGGVLSVHIVESTRLKPQENRLTYNLPDFCIYDEFNNERPNFEVIDQVAGNWVDENGNLRITK